MRTCGKRGTYSKYGCRCELCTKANRDYERGRRAKDKIKGEKEPIKKYEWDRT